MWAPWLIANYHIRRPHIVEDNIGLREIVGMWDGLKGE